MIHFFECFSGCRFHFTEIDQYAVSFQRFSPQDHFNLPVMPVKIFALSSKVLQIVGRSKIADDFYFKKPLVQNPISRSRGR